MKQPLRIPADKVAAIHRDYMAGARPFELGRRYGVNPRSLLGMFRLRGLAIRETWMTHVPRLPNGQMAPVTPATPAEIAAMIRATTRMMLPPRLKTEWRHWPPARRARLVRRLWAHVDALRPGHAMPRTPFSANLTPFDYTSPEAQAIARAANLGTNARTGRVKLKLGNRGVIWEGQLWYWTLAFRGTPDQPKAWGCYQVGPWRPETGRPMLHHAVWEKTHGREVPAGHVIRFVDGNRNNLDPANLVLRPRGELPAENLGAHRLKKARQQTALLFARHQQTDNVTTEKGNHENLDTVRHLRRAPQSPRH